MQRLLLEQLNLWKSRTHRLPLLLDGARQTGKTYLLTQLFARQFKRHLRIDFLERPEFAKAFEDALTPSTILSNLQLLCNQSFDATSDLLILDEIGECQRAVTSLKYFAEQMPQAFITASSSNIGLLSSFPVGKVEHYNLRPLSFHEFLLAGQQKHLINAYESHDRSSAAHEILLKQLFDYYFTGGMPAAVAAWFESDEANMLERVDQVQRIHAGLIAGYRLDFGKYAGQVNAQLIDAVFTQVPSQLSSVMDDSVKRFRFKEVFPRKSRYSDFETAINWLHQCRLVLMNYPIEGIPRTPLVAYRQHNRFKLFLFDVGLLNHMLGTSYQQIREQAYEYKGFIAENFVQQELAALGLEPTHAWFDARAEIEFLMTNDAGQIVPVEVKSGKRTRSKSLASYTQKCQPAKTVKLSATAGNMRDSMSTSDRPANMVLPLYDAALLPTLI